MEPLPPNVAMALAPGQALNSPSLTWAVRGDAQAWFSGLMRVPPAPCRAGGRMVHGHLSFMGRTSCRLTFGGLFTSPYQVGGGGGAGVGRAISPTPGRSPRRSLSRSGSRTCRSRADGPERDPQEVVSPPGTHGATSLKGVPSSWGQGARRHSPASESGQHPGARGLSPGRKGNCAENFRGSKGAASGSRCLQGPWISWTLVTQTHCVALPWVPFA